VSKSHQSLTKSGLYGYDIISQRDYLERLLLQRGIDPWALPDEQENE
jgi:hypothetical protein